MLNHLKNINHYSKIILMIICVIVLIPTKSLINYDLQSIVVDPFLYILNYNQLTTIIFETIVALLFVSAFYTKDSMLLALIVFLFVIDVFYTKFVKPYKNNNK